MQRVDDPDWGDLKTVLALVRHGSLAAAGQALGVNYTTVARRIARVEQALDQTLFERLADGYHPTEAAQLIGEHAARMEAEADAMLRQLSGQDSRLRGPLVITAPQLLIAHVLAPVLQDFAKAYPDIDLHLRASNDLLDLNRREADLAIRISRAPGDSLMGRRLTAQKSAAFAAASYVEAMAKAPEAPIDWLVYEAMAELPAAVRAQSPQSRIAMVFDDMVAMAGAAQAGLGVVRMPLFLGRALGLQPLGLMPAQPYADIWVVAHADLWPSAKVTAFRQMLVPFFKARAARFT
ncbi:LysR family transcriptional regulator [Thalassovita sp.]|uniref:LysR family transcriptional regulator n=1 Tax=Thalassovita sp. TaxID=1979401 RepID=UPI002AB1C892|nr:LysR family transcriptional regulator [Thalassovita sp.]